MLAWSRLGVLIGLLVLLPLAAVAASPPGAGDKAAPALPEPLTREAVRELVSRLSDTEVRELLLAQLDKVAAPAPDAAAPPVAAGLAGNVDRARSELGAVLRAAPDVPATLGAAVARYSRDAPRSTCSASPPCSSSCWRSPASPSAWWDDCSPASVAGSTAARRRPRCGWREPRDPSGAGLPVPGGLRRYRLRGIPGSLRGPRGHPRD